MSVKALALQILQGNRLGNREETTGFLALESGKPGKRHTAPLPYDLTFAVIEREFNLDPAWAKIKDDPRWRNHLAETLHLRGLLGRKEVPPTFTAARECLSCGPVWLEPWTPSHVAGCPWCLDNDPAMPRPSPQSQPH